MNESTKYGIFEDPCFNSDGSDLRYLPSVGS